MSPSRIAALVRAKVWTFINWRRSYYFTLLESTLYLVLLGSGLANQVGPQRVGSIDMPYLEYLYVGLIAVIGFRVFPYLVFNSSNDVKWGMYRLYALSGVTPLEYVLARGINAWMYFLAQWAVLTAGAAIVVGPDVVLPGMALAVLALPGVLFWSCLGVIIGTLIHDLGTRDLVASAAVIPVVFSSSAFYSLDDAPGVLRVLGWLNPLSYQAGSLRLAHVGDWSGAALSGLALLVAVAVLVAVSSFLLPRADLTSGQRA